MVWPIDRRVSRSDSGTWRGHGVLLVADDEEPVRAAATHMLEHLGFEVALATDGRDVTEVFARRHDEVVGILLDMMTPLFRSFGPELNRDTVGNVLRAGFRLRREENVYLDIVKIIEAVK